MMAKYLKSGSDPVTPECILSVANGSTTGADEEVPIERVISGSLFDDAINMHPPKEVLDEMREARRRLDAIHKIRDLGKEKGFRRAETLKMFIDTPPKEDSDAETVLRWKIACALDHDAVKTFLMLNVVVNAIMVGCEVRTSLPSLHPLPGSARCVAG